MEKQNNVKMIIDKTNLTVKFECKGDIWKWLNREANKDNYFVHDILEYVRSGEIRKFYYETNLNYFVDNFKKAVNEVVVV